MTHLPFQLLEGLTLAAYAVGAAQGVIYIRFEYPEAQEVMRQSIRAAEAAGLASGDVLIAIDGLRVTPGNLERMLARHAAGDALQVHAFRRDELMEFQVRLALPESDTARLTTQTRRAAKGWPA